ncbi:hypothetical protein [Paenibacillus donghaensis]|uniref:Uncharacterized protein n=1 Tax=Paenibacillus donghaensis TaxID=414771 RepID=A0A2Z2KIY1_9BACL|nr:hypothetical protein [Paenibacillus donghaensis]ASA20862.1 hypothetical protein B9T62_08755 [Paenibacillus donghaensis]
MSAVQQGNGGELVKLTALQGQAWYAYRGNQAEGSRQLIRNAGEAQWSFKEQLGAGYIFEAEDGSEREAVAVSQMWTRSYVLYKVPAALDEAMD